MIEGDRLLTPLVSHYMSDLQGTMNYWYVYNLLVGVVVDGNLIHLLVSGATHPDGGWWCVVQTEDTDHSVDITPTTHQAKIIHILNLYVSISSQLDNNIVIDET